MSELKSKVFKLETEKKTDQDKYKELLNNYEKSGENFINIQKTMTKLREKDDFDITLIEERYIVLENMLELEKNDLIHLNYNKENVYKMSISYNSFSNELIASLNDKEVFKISDKFYMNSEIGFVSSENGTIFTQLIIE